MKSLEGEIYKKQHLMILNLILNYLNKLVDEYNNTYHHSIDETSIDDDFSALSEETERNPKSPKLKVGDWVTITKYKNILSNDNCSLLTLIIGQEKYYTYTWYI